MPAPTLSPSEKVLVNDITALYAHLDKQGEKIDQFTRIFRKTAERRNELLPELIELLEKKIA